MTAHYLTNQAALLSKFNLKLEDIRFVVGLDIAKNVFQVHSVNQETGEIESKSIKRDDLLKYFANKGPCFIGIEACGSSQYWARMLTGLGHAIKLMHPKSVKPYVIGSKSDANDAIGIFRATTDNLVREVAIKSIKIQSTDSVLTIRTGKVKEQTAAINRFRGIVSEFGITIPKSVKQFHNRAKDALCQLEGVIEETLYQSLQDELTEIRQREETIKIYDQRIAEINKENELARRLKEIPGVGELIACAMSVLLTDPSIFKNGRDFAALLGLVPGHTGSGGKTIMLGITKRGDKWRRALLVQGAMSLMRSAKRPDKVQRMKGKGKPTKVIAVALANKIARCMWAMATTGESYKAFATVEAK